MCGKINYIDCLISKAFLFVFGEHVENYSYSCEMEEKIMNLLNYHLLWNLRSNLNMNLNKNEVDLYPTQ